MAVYGQDLTAADTLRRTRAEGSAMRLADDLAQKLRPAPVKTSSTSPTPQVRLKALWTINPAYFNAQSRFGGAFYVAENPDTALSEVASHGGEGGFGIRFTFNSGAASSLDLTNPEIASEWGYEGGPISSETQAIGAKAAEGGYNAIRFWSEPGGGANYAILGDFGQLLSPQMITPIP